MKSDNERLLSDKMNYLKNLIYRRNIKTLIKALINRFPYLSFDEIEKIVDCVNDICIKNNCFNLKTMIKGDSSVIIKLNNKIIRITNRRYDNYKYLIEYVSDSKSILQPDSEAVVKLNGVSYDMKILELEKLVTKGLTYNDVLKTYFKLREDGYLWYDARTENIGKDKNGNILLHNYGELINLNNLDYLDKKQKINTHIRRKPELSLAYIKYKESKAEEKMKIWIK